MAFRELGKTLDIKKPDGTPIIPIDTAAAYNLVKHFELLLKTFPGLLIQLKMAKVM